MTTKKRLAAYGMAATAAIGGGIGGLALGLGLGGGQDTATVSTELAAASSGAADPGRPAGPLHIDRLGIAAQAIGISADDLRTALQGGKSIAQVAKDHNIDEQKVIDALVAAENTAIDQAVKDGKLTQAQADERKTGFAAHVKDKVERLGLKGPGDHDGPGRGGPGGPGGPDGGGFRGPGGRGPGWHGETPSSTGSTPSTVVAN